MWGHSCGVQKATYDDGRGVSINTYMDSVRDNTLLGVARHSINRALRRNIDSSLHGAPQVELFSNIILWYDININSTTRIRKKYYTA